MFGLLKVFSLIPTGWLWGAAGALLLSLVTWGGAEHWRANHNAAETQECVNANALDRANQTAVALDAATKYLAHSQALQTQVKEANDELSSLRKAHAARLVRAVAAASRDLADNARMRDELAVFAAGGGAAGGDTAASASARAAALGLLLAEALRLDDETLLAGAEAAGAAEAQGDNVRALLKTWPQ